MISSITFTGEVVPPITMFPIPMRSRRLPPAPSTTLLHTFPHHDDAFTSRPSAGPPRPLNRIFRPHISPKTNPLHWYLPLRQLRHSPHPIRWRLPTIRHHPRRRTSTTRIIRHSTPTPTNPIPNALSSVRLYASIPTPSPPILSTLSASRLHNNATPCHRLPRISSLFLRTLYSDIL